MKKSFQEIADGGKLLWVVRYRFSVLDRHSEERGVSFEMLDDRCWMTDEVSVAAVNRSVQFWD